MVVKWTVEAAEEVRKLKFGGFGGWRKREWRLTCFAPLDPNKYYVDRHT